MPITEEKLLEIKAANPGVSLYVLTNPDTEDEIVCRCPSDGEYKRFRHTALSGAAGPLERIVAQKALVQSAIVYPPPEEWAALLAERPGLAETFTGELVEIMGVSQRATHRKI